MFNFLKNKTVSFITDDLDECIKFVSNSEVLVAQIANTIFLVLSDIVAGKITPQQAQKQFTDYKNKCMYEKNLSNCRDPDYASSYILMCFCIFLVLREQPSSRLGMNKILTMCETQCPHDAKAAICSFTKPLRQDFNI